MREDETSETSVLDPDFAPDLEEIIRNRQPSNRPAMD
jgi:hypothetical protein